MRLFTGKRTVGLAWMAAFLCAAAPALFADVDPAASSSAKYDEYGGQSQKPQAQAQDPSRPLGQFPQAEITTVSQSQTVAQAPGPAANANFPKVQTKEDEVLAKKFAWWPTDAQPGPVKDPERSGYWWWPETPGQARPWGNQGYIYVRKIIFDYKTAEGPMKPSLIIKRILKNVKILFDFDKADLRDDAKSILSQAMTTLQHNSKADILITGNADVRGSEQHNLKLGERRADAVRQHMVSLGLPESRIRILSRGKLDALAPRHDLEGMQKDRNAQFMIAEVEEVMIPADKAQYFQDQKEIVEKENVESAPRVGTKDYVIQAGDTLWKIAQREYGDGKQWKRIYEFNQDVIANPDRPKKGTRIKLPIE